MNLSLNPRRLSSMESDEDSLQSQTQTRRSSYEDGMSIYTRGSSSDGDEGQGQGQGHYFLDHQQHQHQRRGDVLAAGYKLEDLR